MKYTIAVILLMISYCSAAANMDEEIEVKQTYQLYRTALLNQDGASAWEKMDSHTKNYYKEIAKDSLTIERDDLDRLDMLSKILIMRMRLEFRIDHIRTLTGLKIYKVGVEKGWISKSTAQAIKQIDKVKIEGNLAQGFISQYPDTPILFFTKEDGWKIALWKSLEQGNLALKQMAKEKGMSENEFIKAMLEQMSKYKFDDRIFDGPLK